MELDSIKGYKLNEIQKKPDSIRLTFADSRGKMLDLTMNGLLFESTGSALNKKVKKIELNNTLGYRAISQLQHMKRDPDNYRQLFIQMEGSSEGWSGAGADGFERASQHLQPAALR